MKKFLIKVYLFIIILSLALFFTFFVLGNVERTGYLSGITLNVYETLRNNSISYTNSFKINKQGKDMEEYVLTNNSINSYIYNVRVSYYSKVFRNSDIYGVYIVTNSLPEYINELIIEEKGSPYFKLISTQKIDEKNIYDIKYVLKIKSKFIKLVILVLFVIFFIYMVFFIYPYIKSIFYLIKNNFAFIKKIFNIVFVVLITIVIIFSFLYFYNVKSSISNISLDINKTFDVNNIVISTLGLELLDKKFNNYDEINEYVLTNIGIQKYVYNFKFDYKNNFLSDNYIYKIVPDIKSISTNILYMDSYSTNSKFGYLISKNKLENNIYNINYRLLLKKHILLFLFIFLIILIFNHKIFNFNLKFNSHGFIVFIFLAILILPSIVYKLNYDRFDHKNYENRILESKPIFNLSEISSYIKQYEKYFNDNLAFRNEFIKLNNYFEIFIFKNILTSSENFLGKDHMTFYKPSVKDYIGENDFTEEELETAKNNLLHFRDELKKRNIDFVLMICLDKIFIYDDYAPNYLKRKSDVNLYEQFIDYMSNNTDIKIVYPKDELRSYKKDYQLYYTYFDGHWNELGGYLGYQSLMKKMNMDYIKLENTIITSNKIYEYNGIKEYSFKITNYTSNNFKLMRGVRHYLHSGYCVSDADNTNNILFIRDSFTIAMFDYIASSFNKSSFINRSFFKIEDIVNVNPNIVVFEVLGIMLKNSVLITIPNYKIEEINKDLQTNSIAVNN